MNTASKMKEMLAEWKAQGLSKAEVIWKEAEACIGWPYVFGARGELCKPATRRQYYNNYINSKPAEAQKIKDRCQALSKGLECTTCTYFPGGYTECFDCRGFTYRVLLDSGITINGAGATSQWNDDSNWAYKGEIQDLPEGQLACFFHQDQSDHKTMQHTGFIKDGVTIHCSGTVKKEKPSRYITHFAVPKGLDGGIIPVTYPTLRKGSAGEYVTLLQTKLIQQGYDLEPYGADGKFGNKTLAAVKLFQANHNLEQDGVVGRKTWDALMEGKATLYTVTIQHVGQKVAEQIVEKYGGVMQKEGD